MTQLVKFTDLQSVWKSAVKNLQSRQKKQKKYCRVRNELSIKDHIKAHNINLASVSLLVRKKLLNLPTEIIQFTDQQISLKKQQTVDINLSIYVYTKYLPI